MKYDIFIDLMLNCHVSLQYQSPLTKYFNHVLWFDKKSFDTINCDGKLTENPKV